MNNTNDTNANDTKPHQAFDPGWNDPPKFSYTTQQTTPNRPRNFLNKRVAFPLSTAQSGSPAPMSLPPMPSAPLIPIIPSMPPTLPAMQPPGLIMNPSNELDSQNTFKEVKEILFQFLESSSELGTKSNDIKRRLGVMEDMWLSGKLNTTIQQQMKELAYADEIHKALMVDHVSSVGVWMPGVKQLIHHCIARSELLSIEKEQPNED
ncbi:Steroid receptor RNA activator 1 [Operophtera brumata]|uniref:Steroid receptor RNA activator 1 n=1 Tax=Operophtera brumata TaxID=104452 RepID=A0A0L7L127_OPEBR|nr:Steroid receptor RNA activator 1 [Operophtera brumata]